MAEVMCVIGGNYGDEGKGLITDFYASRNPDALVIRANGGAQAGHSVCTPNGDRHVFSHFGSGTLAGNSTFLSDPFVVNPLLFQQEWNDLSEIIDGEMPKIYVDEQCMVTTPFDMLINQTLETMRGDDPHGSCGVGFGETIHRCLNHIDIAMIDIKNTDIFAWNDAIRKDYILTRVDLSKINDTFKKVLYNDRIIVDFIAALEFMLDRVEVIDTPNLAYKLNLRERPMIFEGAQGLLLDQNYGFFPHVTRSNCGMKNISSVLRQTHGTHNVTVNYVTRAYTTRHGAGPLELENVTIPDHYNIVDETNIPNEWQHSLRFAPLNLDLFNSVTSKDFALHAPKGARSIDTMTCMDQLGPTVSTIKNGRIEYYERDVFVETVQVDFRSFGPTRNDVIDCS